MVSPDGFTKKCDALIDVSLIKFGEEPFVGGMYLKPPDPHRVASSLAGRLWARVRLGQIGGYHFSRHCPVGRCIADFYCAETRLVVQLESARTTDRGRNERADQFELDGYRVVRVSEYELIDDIETAVQKIAAALNVAPKSAAELTISCISPRPPRLAAATRRRPESRRPCATGR